VGNWSSGIYVAVVELHDGHSVTKRRMQRLAFQR